MQTIDQPTYWGQRCEDLEDAEGLRHMYMITRGAIMLGDFGVLEVLMSEENVMDTVGALEYEPDLPVTPKHREFLRDKVSLPLCVSTLLPAEASTAQMLDWHILLFQQCS